nr:uncharacterized protein LOC106040340 [Anser cygnoides]
MVSGLQPCQGGVVALAWCWRGWGQLMAAGRGLLPSVPLIARQISPHSRRVKLCAAAGVVPPRSLPIGCHPCPADDLLLLLVLRVLRPRSEGSCSWAGGHHADLEQPVLKRGRCESAVNHKHSVLNSRVAQGRFAPGALQREKTVRRSSACQWGGWAGGAGGAGMRIFYSSGGTKGSGTQRLSGRKNTSSMGERAVRTHAKGNIVFPPISAFPGVYICIRADGYVLAHLHIQDFQKIQI